MASKRSTPLEDPPTASSSSDEEEENEEESEEEESDEEQHHHEKNKKASSPPPSVVEMKSSSSSLKKPESQSSEDESDSGSDSDSDNAPDPNVKPIASKPVDDPKKSSSKPIALPTKSAAAGKRSIDNNGGDGKDSKRAKNKAGDVELEEKKSGEESKKQLFQRLWSEDDELAILKGMIEYISKKGVDPMTEVNAFLDFIKKSLHVDVTKAQLSDKVRRLKKKYENNVGKGKKGADRTFSKPHEQQSYDLSKKIWGGEVNTNDNGGVGDGNSKRSGSSNQKSSKRLTSLEKEQLLSSPNKEASKNLSRGVKESICFSKSIGMMGLDEEVMKRGLDLIGGSKKIELEEKWRKLQMAETELFLRRVELIREQTELVLDAYKVGSEH